MRAMFDQPKHLSEVRYQRVVRTVRPLVIVSALLLSGLALIALWRRTEAGQQISTTNWLLGGSVGLWVALGVWLCLRLELRNRHNLEVRENGLLLTGRGGVAFQRFLDWSITPDPVEPRYKRLRLTYKLGFARKQWTMLLDDAAQNSELRDALKKRIPRRTA